MDSRQCDVCASGGLGGIYHGPVGLLDPNCAIACKNCTIYHKHQLGIYTANPILVHRLTLFIAGVAVGISILDRLTVVPQIIDVTG